MESKRRRLRASVIHDVARTYKRGHTRNRHDMAMILLNHRRQELSHHPEMRDSVNLKGLLNDLFRAIQDRESGANASIVD